MVFRLYDKNMNYLTGISEYKDLKISEELDTGYKVCQFSLPYTMLVQEEMKIDIDGYRYVIKEVNMEDLGLYDVYCKPYFGKLSSKHIDSLTGYNMSLQSCLDVVMAETDWTYEVADDLTGSYQLNMQRKTAIDAINILSRLFQAEMKIDTLNHKIWFYNKRQASSDILFIDGKNLLKCRVQSNTYDLVTRLIPIGKDEQTIVVVNNGQIWVENYEYTDEIITAYWIDQSIENPDDLLKTARAKIKELGKPTSAYRVYTTEFTRKLEVGDEVKVIDKIRGVNTTKRVQKTVFYPAKPEESYVELGSLQVSFDKLYKDLSDAQKVVNEDTLRSITELSKSYDSNDESEET